MTDYLSKTIDELADRIDGLAVMRATRARDLGNPATAELAADFRVAIADCLTDFVAALKDELTETFATR